MKYINAAFFFGPEHLVSLFFGLQIYGKALISPEKKDFNSISVLTWETSLVFMDS